MEQNQPESSLLNWQRRFFTIWTGQAFSLFGSNLVQFALVWWITDTYKSATVLALATLVALLPQVILGPFAGALVDRWNRKIVMMAADGIVALVSLGLAALYFTGAVQVWHVLAAMLIRSAGGAFHWPAMQASTSLMVPDKQLSRVAGLNQALFGIMNIVAPPAGAFLLDVFPMERIILIDVITAALAIFTVSLVKIPQPKVAAVEPGSKPASLWADVKAGWNYAKSWRGLFILGIVATLLNFLITPAFSLMPILVTKVFNGAAFQLGLINSAWGIGVVVGGLALGAWGGFKKKVYTSMLGLIGMGIGILIISMAPANLFAIAVAGMALAGIFNPIANGPLFAILQSTVAPEMQGRIFTLIGSASAAMSPLSLLLAGPIADAIGVRWWYVAAGAFTLIMALVSLTIPAILHLEDDAIQVKAQYELQK